MADLDEDLEVVVETQLDEDGVRFPVGEAYRDWETVTVRRPLAALAGGFSLDVVPHEVLGIERWPIRPGALVRLVLGREQLLEGYIDELEGETSTRGRRMRISGRDRTADLVDASALNMPGEWLGLPLVRIVEELAAPFGIEVQLAAGGAEIAAPFAAFKLQPGESVGSAIERALRARAVLGFTTGDGRLTIARPAASRSEVGLIEGQNVKRARLRWTDRDRFRVYTVRSQTPGSDEGWGETVAAVEGRAEDHAVDRYRPLLIIGESSLNFSSAADRARWEATVRAARSQTLEVEVAGWRRAPRERVWRPNETVPVRIPSLEIRTDLLVNEVTFRRSPSQGTTTLLELVRADAYTPEPEVPASGPLDPS